MTTPVERDTLADVLARVLADMTGRDPHTLEPQTHLFLGLGMTSGNAVELVMRLEDELALDLRAGALEWHHLETIGSLTDYLAARSLATAEDEQ